MPRRPALPKDPNQRAKKLLDMVLGDTAKPQAKKLTETQEFARQGGLKGGVARAQVLSAKERRQIAKKAAEARWRSKPDG